MYEQSGTQGFRYLKTVLYFAMVRWLYVHIISTVHTASWDITTWRERERIVWCIEFVEVSREDAGL